MALKLRRRPQFWKNRKTLGDATSDFLKSTLPAYQVQVYAIQCADPSYWTANDICQSLFPEGASSAGSSSGCAMDTSSFEAKINDLKQNWNPTGVYTPDDLDSIVHRLMGMVNAQHNLVMTFQASYDTSYAHSVGDEFVAIGKQAVDYNTASRDARATGKPVSAPNFKAWVVAGMESVLNGMRELAIAACSKPFFLDALGTFDSAMSDLWSAAKSIAGLAVDFAKTAIHAVEQGVGLAAWLVKWLPTGIVALGAIAVAGTGFYYWNKRTRRYPAFLPPG